MEEEAFNTLLAEFDAKFAPLYKTSPRLPCYRLIADILFRKGRPVNILETGCVWTLDWVGQGCSTRMWEWLTSKAGGSIRSIDISEEHVTKARAACPSAEVILGNSLEVLLKLDISNIDLLFLDSYDHNPPYGLSELHAIGELATCYERLPSGCLIAVDDCNPTGFGKHNFIKMFFKRMEIAPLTEGYIHVWQKP